MSALSLRMIEMLENVQAGLGTHGALAGRAHRGGYSTARALRKRGLLGLDGRLTDEGTAALKKAKP